MAVALPAAGLLAAKWAGTSEVAAGETGDTRRLAAIGVPVLEAEEQTSYEMKRVFIGRVEARRSGALGFERAGMLTQILVREGDRVRRGEPLARLDRAVLQARRAELSAALASAEANLALAKATRKRHQKSVKNGAVTRQALDEALEGANAAEANAQLAQARIASIDVDLAKTELTTPFDGIVTRRVVDEGQVLSAGATVLELQEDAVPEIRVGVGGTLSRTLRAGERYPLTVNDQALSARLRTVLPLRSARSRSVDALFEPEDANLRLRPGELAELTLTETIHKPGLWLPISALTQGQRGLWRTLVASPLADDDDNELGATHRLSPRPLQVLYVEGERAYVRGDLRQGAQVVAAGHQHVVAGQLVRALPASPGTQTGSLAEHGLSQR